LFVFVLDGTSSAELAYMQKKEAKDFKECTLDPSAENKPLCRALYVAQFPTLKELDPDEVEMADWVGRTIANRYARAIDCIIGEIPGLKSTEGAKRSQEAEGDANHCASEILK
jgi:hypothetical protein